MKKFFQSKGFIVSSLALLCVTILGVCWFVSRDRTGDFRPDESPPSSVTGDWSDGGTQTDGDNGADAYAPGQSTDAEEEYPKVTSQTEDEVVIDFTDTEKPEETPPPVPEGKTEIKDSGQEHTVNPDPSVPEVTAPPAEQAPPSNEPVPGSSNGNGAVYVVDSALTKSAASDFLTRQDYDLIVLDVNLPDGNGFDFCREVKDRRPDTAVIFLTANDMESDSRGLGDGRFLLADYLSIYRGRCSNDFSRSKVPVCERSYIRFFRFLHSILLSISCSGQGSSRFLFGSMQTRYLLCSCHFAVAYGMGNERNSICPAHCRYNFRSNHAIYGNASS